MSSCAERTMPSAPTRATQMKGAADRVQCPNCKWYVPRNAEQQRAGTIPAHAGM